MVDAQINPFEWSDVPHDLFSELRGSCPVARTKSGWFLASFDDVSAATKHVEVFAASFREPGVVVPPEEQFINEILEPRHGKIRKIINSAVSHHKAMAVESFVRDLCNEYLDPIIANGGGELIEEFIAPLPIHVICHLIGVPRADWAHFRRWSDEVVQGTYTTKYYNERGSGLAGAHPEFTEYVDTLIAERRAMSSPPADLVTRLLTTVVDGDKLTDVEVRTQLIFIIISGNETTRHLIGNLFATCVTNPAIFARLKADRALVDRAVEESLRIDSPIHILLRDCLQANDMFGVRMEVGEKVAFGIASANRDETHHSDPHSFLLDRDNWRDHVAFGGGPHVCPGALLARLEAKVALETFLDRVDHAVAETDWVRRKAPVFWANGVVDLPVLLG